jgi:preprotein translocase subunit SecD
MIKNYASKKRKATVIYRMTLILAFILLILPADGKSTGRHTKQEDALTGNSEQHIKDKSKIAQADNTILTTGWYYVTPKGKGIKQQLDKSNEIYFLDKHPIVTARNFSKFLIDGSTVAGPKKYAYRLVIELDDAGADYWSIATKKSIGKQLAFVVRNRLLYVVKVFDQLDNGITVMDRGSDSKEELEKLKKIIESER